jgi:glycosyltransferase involved in cell wall biosynthesis
VLICGTSSQLPPGSSGGAVLLDRLLRDMAPRHYALVAIGREGGKAVGLARLPAPTRRFGSAWQLPSDYRRSRLGDARSVRRFVAEGARRGRLMARVLRDEGCTGLLTTSSETPNVLAGAVAARIARVPFGVYLMDDWRHQVAIRHPWLFADLLQRQVLARAAACLVVSPLLAEELRAESGIPAEVVNHVLPPDVALEPPVDRPWPNRPGAIRLVYTGNIYRAHFGALADVLRALEAPGLEQVTLHVYTQSPAAVLAQIGVEGRMVVHPPVGQAELRVIQAEADILLLPLAFDTIYPEIVRTAVPTKTAEYLVSGRPMLTVAPPDSHIATLARVEGCSALADERGPQPIVRALKGIIDDAGFRRRLVENAWRVALRDHAPAATVEPFRRALIRLAGG